MSIPESQIVNKTAAFHNLGCKVNAYETQAMQQLLENAGYTIVPFDSVADVYVINTCSVTNIADRKSRQMLHRARKMNPKAVIVAAGCYVQTALDKTHHEVDADILIGNDKKGELPAILAECFEKRDGSASGEEAVHVLDMTRHCDYEPLRISEATEHTRAFVKVQDGCNQFCSYCIIPYARGRIRSRDLQDTLEEIRRLTAKGIREIVLTGIHLSSYGMDTGGGNSLADLIEKVSRVEGVERIRLGSLEPRIITEAFAGRLHQVPQLCPQFHLSLQSGSDSVLQRMNRHYTTVEFENACDILRRNFDHPALTTDVITGFPGETEEEFAQTVSFLKKIRFYETHIFRFSARAGTPAGRMPGQLTEKIKAGRSDILIRLGQENKAAFEKEWEGKPCEVLMEEKILHAGRSWYTGYTREYIKVMMQVRNGQPDAANRIWKGEFRIHGNACIFDGIVLK